MTVVPVVVVDVGSMVEGATVPLSIQSLQMG